MALEGEYATEKAGWVADQLAKIDETGTTASVAVAGMAVVVFTYRGPKSGKLYRRPLMRVEHDGVYAAFASKGGAPENPVWYSALLANDEVEVQDGTTVVSGRCARSTAPSGTSGGRAASPRIRRTPSTRRRRTA